MSSIPHILTINSGSSSLKWKLFSLPDLEICQQGMIEGKKITFSTIKKRLKVKESELMGIAHRVVHGGMKFFAPIRVTKKLINELEKLSELAPLHQKANLNGIREGLRFFPSTPHFAFFDTAFFHRLPEAVVRYALPEEYYSEHNIRRYGFHGLSHEWALQESAKLLRKPSSSLHLVTCHLGSGASLAMIQHGKPIDTTMGFTPVEGLTMGTRVGDLDPMVPLYLMKRMKMTVSQVERLLNLESGLLGVSGFSSDMREILSASSGIPVLGFSSKRRYTRIQRERATLALEMFLYDARRYLAAYLGLLSRIDAIVFTGGIGEASPVIRQKILKGQKIDSSIKVLVIPANEEKLMAQTLQQIIQNDEKKI